MHYMRWRKWGDPRVVKQLVDEPTADRFWRKVAKQDDGCWTWQAGKKNGYGCFWLSRDSADWMVMAHRFAWEQANGPVPAGMTLDHLCHTAQVATCPGAGDCAHRSCVRPNHLEPVPLGENIRRGGNGAKTHCKRGHEFTPENTYVLKRGGRSCRICLRMHGANSRERKRQAQKED